MRIDYRERSFINKNKPRRQPIGMYAIGMVVASVLLFTLGFASGWGACWYRNKKLSAVQQGSAQSSAGAKPEQPLQSEEAKKGKQTPYSFYDTLPRGGKGVIGSGINANLPEHQPMMPPKPDTPTPQPQDAKPAPAPQQAVKAPAQQQPANQQTVKAPLQPAQPAQSPQKPQPQTASPKQQVQKVPDKPSSPPQPPAEGDRKYTVQVASVKDKTEAESLKAKLVAKGYNAMVIEVKVPDKGVLYRVRAGRHMEQRDAQHLAEKLGSGAIAVPE